MTDVAAPTMAVVLSWVCIGLVLLGCGYTVRRLFVRGVGGSFRAADLWLGFAVLLIYLQFWNLLLAVGWYVWVSPIALGVVGLFWGARHLREERGVRPSIGAIAPAAICVLWLANRALAAPTDYDLGLYHLSAIEYALHYATVPGLGNLHARLAAGDAHLLFVASLEHGPWGGAGFHLANGLLVSMLLIDGASRFTWPRSSLPLSFTQRMALLLVPATIVVVGVGSAYRLSSPNLDLAAYVLVAVGALYLAECLERGFEPVAAVTAIAAFAAAAVTRPLYWLPTVLASCLLLLAVRQEHAQSWHRLAKTGALICTLPLALLIGMLARQAVLSGYPFFPSTILALPVDWRMAASAVHSLNAAAEAWARWPGKTPATLGGTLHWLDHWARTQTTTFDVMAPIALLAALIPSLSSRTTAEIHRRRSRTKPLLAVLATALPTLTLWFLIAPDPRFALALLWLIPIALLAWALPSPDHGQTAPLLIAIAAVSLAFVVFVGEIRWLALAAFDVWTIATIATRKQLPKRSRSLIAYAAVLTVLAVPLKIIATDGAFDAVTSNHGGPFGTPVLPTPVVDSFRTNSGLELSRPVQLGSDQCWRITLCTPDPNPDLRLRGSTISSGFNTLNPPASPP